MMVTLEVLYRLVLQAQTPEQREAVKKEIALLTLRLDSAVKNGDPAGKTAFEELRRNPPNRR